MKETKACPKAAFDSLSISVDVLHQAGRQYLFTVICAICIDILFELVSCIQAKVSCGRARLLFPFGSKVMLKQQCLF